MLPFDEINRMSREQITTESTAEEAEDFVEDLLLMAYALGYEEMAELLGLDKRPSSDDVYAVIDAAIAGETYRDRVRKYAEAGAVEDIIRVIETETHRVFETAKFNAAVGSGKAVMKRWDTMLDDRVRDTHIFLEGSYVPLNAKFYTYDGDSAYFPGGFELPQNNINCRCGVSYTVV